MHTIDIPKPETLDDMAYDRGGYVIAASAGTGKTYTLEHLVLDRIVEWEVDIDEILVVTFTRRATAEMKGRVREMLEQVLRRWEQAGGGVEFEEPAEEEASWEIDADAAENVRHALDAFGDASISTIHAFCQEVLSDYAFSSGQLFDAELVDSDELFEECFYEVLRERLAVETPHRKWLEALLEAGGDLQDLAGHLQKICSQDPEILPEREKVGLRGPPSDEAIRDDDGDLDQGKIYTACWHLFREPLAERVERKKREQGLLTYDDLLTEVRDRLDDGLADFLREQYKVVLVDEFQDTDPVQWEIFQRTFLQDDSDGELIVIGDEKQSIYGFRGADVETYRTAVGDEGFAGHVELPFNYRSTPELIAAYDRFFEASFFGDDGYPGVDAPKKEEEREERDLRGAIGDEPIEVLHLNPPVEAKLSKKEAQGAFVERTADQIEDLLADDEYTFVPTDESEERALEPGDIYVLTRTNREADEVGDALATRGISHSFFRKPGLFDTDEALEVIRLLRGIARPSDRSRRRKAMLTPFFGIRLDELLVYEQGDTNDRMPREQLENWHRISKEREYTSLFQTIMRESGVVRRELVDSAGERRLTNYRHLFEWLLEKAAGTQVPLEQLADLLYRYREGFESDDEEEGSDLQRLETDRSSVQIMTIHKCKGLSAEVVFVCGGLSLRDDKNYNRDLKLFTYNHEDADVRRDLAFHRKGQTSDDVDAAFQQYVREEIERLFYVAITRARAKVYLPYVGPEHDHGNWNSKSELRILLDGLTDLMGPELSNPPDGFEVDEFDLSDVELEPDLPVLVESADFLDEIAGLDELVSLHPPRRPGIGMGVETFDQLRKRRCRTNESYSSLASHATDRGEAVEETHEMPLPKSIQAGNFLHKTLELLDYTSARDVNDWEAWLNVSTGDRTVRELIVEQLEANGFDDEYLEYSAERIYRALQTPLETTGDTLVPPLAEIPFERTAREVDFVVPVPACVDGQSDGYLNGEIDLVFEHDGRVYVADWKSDTRIGGTRYDRETLGDYIEREYREQRAVYTTALVRMLGIEEERDYEERFGGFFYLFVRGMSPETGEGYHFDRFEWSKIESLFEAFAEAPLSDVIEA